MAKRTNASAPDRFFVRELSGEEPLTIGTAKRLVTAAAEVGAQQPWRQLFETQHIFVLRPETKEPDVCSVSGAAHGLYAIAVHLGTVGYAHLLAMQNSYQMSATLFFEHNQSLRISYEPKTDLTKLDKDMLRAAGFPLDKAKQGIVFRSYRPGCLDWYVSEPEGQRALWGLWAVIAVGKAMRGENAPDLWAEAGRFPLVQMRQENGSVHADISLITPPQVSLPPDPPVEVDPADAAMIARLNRKESFALDAAFQIMPVPVGRKHERKVCMRMALAADGRTGFAFEPILDGPDAPSSAMLYRAVVAAIRASGAIPAEIRVSEQRFENALQGFADQFNIKLKLADTRAADAAMEGIKGMLSGRG